MKHNNITLWEYQKEKRPSEGSRTYLKKKMTENLPHLVKERSKVQEAQRVPNNLDLKRPTERNIIFKMARLKDKDRILKATREKQVVTYKGIPIRLSSISQQKRFRPEAVVLNIHDDEKQGSTTTATLPSKAIN